jgi:predicted Zn-dependent protease
MESKGRYTDPMHGHSVALALGGLLTANALVAAVVSEGLSDSRRPTEIILVTLDTTRADALGSWGGPPTPTLDRLAESGTRFSHAVTSSPLTLPAHASLFSGRDPLGHGLRRNGQGRLSADIPVVAEALQRRGWATAAIIGSLVLDRRHGLDRGFDLYDDHLVADHAGQYGIPERDAETITDLAIAWLAARPRDRPCFLWVHYYDAHAPYNGPGNTDRERYLGEIAHIDRELGRLVDSLAPDHVVVVVGDHGEALGERGERMHGLRLHSPTLAVPLIVEGVGVPVGKVVEETVSTSRVAATMIAATRVFDDGFGLPLPGIWSMIESSIEPRPVFSETLLPLDLYGWAPLAAVTIGSMRLVASPKPRLYDLSADPGETHDLMAEQLETAARLGAMATEWWRPPPGADSAPITDAATQTALEALGYAVAGERGDGIGPEDGIELHQRIDEADALLAAGRVADGAALLDAILVRNPSNPAAWARLAVARSELGQSTAAVMAAKRAVTLRPTSVLLAMRLAEILLNADDTAAARAAYDRVIELDPRWAPAWTALADLAAGRGDIVKERQVLRSAVERVDSVALLTRLARLEAAADPPGDSKSLLDRAVGLDPGSPLPWLTRGDLALTAGHPGDAVESYSRASELAPLRADAALGMGRALLALGNPVRARANLRRAAVLGRGTPIAVEADATLAAIDAHD